MTVQLLNMIGDGLLTVGATILIAHGSDPGADLTLILLSSSAVGIAALFGSSIMLDSINRRAALILLDVLRILAALLVTLYMTTSQSWVLALAGSCVGLSVSVYRPALSAYIGDVFSTDQRTAANSLRSLASKLSGVAGPAVAGILGALHVERYAPAVAGILAALSICAFLLGPKGTIKADLERDAHPFAAFRYVWHRSWIFAVISQGAVQIGFVSAPMSVLLPLWLAQHGATAQYGFIVAIEAAGAAITAILLIRIPRLRPEIAVPILLLQAPSVLVIAINAPSWLLYPASFALGVAMCLFGVLWIGALQEQVPATMLGRVLSVDALGNGAFSVAGLALAGFALERFSPASIAAFMTVVLIASVVGALLVPGVLRLGRAEA
jgi:MFS family permease